MELANRPRVVLLGGPNGAGKSTSARMLLQGALEVDEFVNADVIAQGLSGFAPERVALTAGRLMLRRLKELAQRKKSFGFESTLASRSFAPWLTNLSAIGYEIHVTFMWLPNEETAVARVAERVRLGGHHVPETTIRRRYWAGLRNFFQLYQPLADTWQMVDNSGSGQPRLIAAGVKHDVMIVKDDENWQEIKQKAGVET